MKRTIMTRRSARPITRVRVIAAALIASAALAKPPTSRPAHTHTLRLEEAGQNPSNFLVRLPDDWTTNATHGERWYDWTRDPDQTQTPRWVPIELALTHGADGGISLDLMTGATDVNFTVTLKPVGDHYEGTWRSLAAFGPDGKMSDRSGTASFRAVRSPASRPSP